MSFFDKVILNGDQGTFNGLTFTLNAERTHFEATSIMDQCSELLGTLNQRGYSTRTWADFIRGKLGRIPSDSFYETKGHGRKLMRWVVLKEVHRILSYSMSGRVDVYMNGGDWKDNSGYVYLIRISNEDKTIVSNGYATDLTEHFPIYQQVFPSFELLLSCHVNDMISVQNLIAEYLRCHGAEQHPEIRGWFYVNDNQVCVDWMNALYEIDPKLVITDHRVTPL